MLECDESNTRSLLGDHSTPNEEDNDRPAWMFVLIPFISALVGFLTNVLALKMSFYPAEFVGIKIWKPKGQPFGLFGWQGIVPAKAGTMASRLTHLFVTKLFDLREIFSRINPSIVQQKCQPATKKLTDRIVEQTLDLFVPHMYHSLSEGTKREIREAVSSQSATMVSKLMTSVQENVLHLLDLCALMERLAEEKKSKVVEMFLEVGQKEYRFVEMSGFWFGLLFGGIQALVYYFYDVWWLLPLAGLFVGWCTNYLALKLIFEPAEPIHILGLKIQGVFLKRQQEASVSIAALSQNNFLTVDHIMEEIAFGNGQQRFDEILHDITKEHIQQILYEKAGIISPLLVDARFPEILEEIIVNTVHQELKNIWPLAYSYIEEAMDLKETIQRKLRQLPPREFVGTLRPVFQEDEIKLIVIGAILGMTVGFLQHFLLMKWIT